MNPLGFIWALTWYNPYTNPPPGWPRTVAEIFIPSAHPGEGARRSVEISDACHELITAGQTGYVITCTALMPASKQLPPETLARVRQQRLERRVQKQAPLLAGELIQDELAAKPDYYAGVTDPETQDRRDAVLQMEAERRKWFLDNPHQMRIYPKSYAP